MISSILLRSDTLLNIVLTLPAWVAHAHRPGELFPFIEPFDGGDLKVSGLYSPRHAPYGCAQGEPTARAWPEKVT